MRSERERLLDILEAIERIEKYARRGKEAFDNDESNLGGTASDDDRRGLPRPSAGISGKV